MNLHMNPMIIAGALALAIVGATAGWQSQAGERVSLAEVSHIHGIAVDPSDPQRLYLATHYGVWLTGGADIRQQQRLYGLFTASE